MTLKPILLGLLVGLTLNAYAESDNYQLTEVVALSRHSVRTPLSSPESTLGQVTPHSWVKWSAPKSELTLRGGILETEMGQYWRKYLDKAGLIKEDVCPNLDEINLYANSMQRTVATANYFASGFKPTCHLNVYHRFKPSKMDPIFFPRLTKVTPDFIKMARSQINHLNGFNHVDDFTYSLKPIFKNLEKVLDLKQSPLCQKEKFCQFNDFKTEVMFKKGDEPRLKGNLLLGTKIADALVLQYLEDSNEPPVIFKQKISFADIQNISKIKDTYGDILFSAPIVAVNVAHPLLTYMRDELLAPNRKLTYLVGHDSNLTSVMSALDIIPPTLENSLESRTPIGSKLLFEKFVDKKTGKLWIKLSLMYQSSDQIRHLSILDLDNPPMQVALAFKGLEKNPAGFYAFEEVIERFNHAIHQYELIQ